MAAGAMSAGPVQNSCETPRNPPPAPPKFGARFFLWYNARMFFGNSFRARAFRKFGNPKILKDGTAKEGIRIPKKIAGWFAFREAKANRTGENMWLHVLLAALLSFLPVLYFLEFSLLRDVWFAPAGLLAYGALRYFSRDFALHPVLAYSCVWLGATLAVFINLTVMPFLWLLGYWAVVAGLFLPKTEFTKNNPAHTDEFVEGRLGLARRIRPALAAMGFALFVLGSLLNS